MCMHMHVAGDIGESDGIPGSGLPLVPDPVLLNPSCGGSWGMNQPMEDLCLPSFCVSSSSFFVTLLLKTKFFKLFLIK